MPIYPILRAAYVKQLLRIPFQVTVEEYTFETERSHGKVNYSKLTVLQRVNDDHYLGQLYVDRDYVEGKSHGSMCK